MVNRQKKALGWVGTITQGSRMVTGKKLGRAINDRAVDAASASPASFKKGGRVKKTGLAKVHKNEVVLNKKVVAALKKLMH
jgi:hypothetical protein